MPVLEGLQLITQRVKATAIYNAVGKPSAWYTQRVNSCSNNGSEFKFTQADVNLLNSATAALGDTVSRYHVSGFCTRAECINNIREIGKVVKMSHLRDDILHCNAGYWNNRTQNKQLPDSVYRFTEDELQAINTELQDIAKMLHEITLTL